VGIQLKGARGDRGLVNEKRALRTEESGTTADDDLLGGYRHGRMGLESNLVIDGLMRPILNLHKELVETT
jgi:hypothetical protein